jgi:hypothetical protein
MLQVGATGINQPTNQPQSNITAINSVEDHITLKGKKINASKSFVGRSEARLLRSSSFLERITLKWIVLILRVEWIHLTHLTSSTELK